MNHVHGNISIRMHLVLRPSPAGMVATLLQSADVARLLAAEPGARAYSLGKTRRWAARSSTRPAKSATWPTPCGGRRADVSPHTPPHGVPERPA